MHPFMGGFRSADGKPRRKVIGAFLLAMLPAAHAAGSDMPATIAIDSASVNGMLIGHAISYLIDRDAALTIEQVIDSSRSREWIKSTRQIPGFGFTANAYWIRIPLCNTAPRQLEFLIEVGYGLLDDVQLFIPQGASFTVRLSGDLKPFRQREIKHHNFIFPLVQQPGMSVYYLRVHSTCAMNIPLKIWSPDTFTSATRDHHLVMGIIYGILLIMSLYNLIVFCSTRDIAYLYYVLFIVSYSALTLALSGMGFQYVWPDTPWLCNSVPLFLFLTIATGIVFSQRFLHLAEYAPHINFVHTLFAGISLVMAAASCMLPYRISINLAAGLAVFILIFLYLTEIGLFRKGSRASRFSLIAWTAVVIGALSTLIMNFGAIPNNFFTIWGFQIGGIANIVVFSFGLLDKVNGMKIKVEHLHTNLGELVEERTHDLHSAMERLDGQNRQLSKAKDSLWGEMQLAKKIQTALLPQKVTLSGYEIAVHMLPAAEVGGDYYDVISAQGKEWICIGDVSGHGVSAGLVQMMVQTSIHFALGDTEKQFSPSQLLSRINRTITRNMQLLGEQKYMTITALACQHGGEIAFAGLHQDLLVYRHGAKMVEEIGTTGIWLGVLNEIDGMLRDTSIQLEPQDVLVMYTDGITEALRTTADGTEEMFGQKRLCEILATLGSTEPRILVKRVFTELAQYRRDDDATIVVIRREGPAHA